jgi:hypothetical protein
MTQAQFDNGYWYATELREFAKTIGIPSASRLRKDELEKAIKFFLKAGKIESPAKRSLSTSGIKDVEQGLSLSLPVAVYTNDKETKDFLEREAQKTCSWPEKEIRRAISAQSLARRATRQRRQAQLRRPGQRIRAAEPDQGAVRANPTWEVHQLHERLLRWRERRHVGAGVARLEEAEEARRTQELSFVGEAQLVLETDVTFDTIRA